MVVEKYVNSKLSQREKVLNKLLSRDVFQYTLFDGPIQWAAMHSYPEVTRTANGGIEIMVSDDDVDDMGKVNYEEIKITFTPEDIKELLKYL